MGKIKRPRQIFHSHAPRNNSEQDVVMLEPASVSDHSVPVNADTLVNKSNVKTSGIFSSVEIPPSVLQQQLPDSFDRQSIISSISSKGHLNKKNRRTLKHELFLQKLEAAKAAKKKLQDGGKKKNTAGTNILCGTIPTLEHLMKKNKDHDVQHKPRASKTFKQQKQEMLHDISVFQQVLQHPTYIANPFETITAHIKASLQAESENCT